MELINNTTKTLKDDLSVEIKQGSKLSIAAACFSIYAFQELKEQLSQIEELRFIFTSPTFVTEKAKKERREFYIPRLTRERNLYGTEFEIKLRNELTQKAIARECAEWIRQKVTFKSNVSDKSIQGQIVVDGVGYTPINNFTTVELGCEKGNVISTTIVKDESLARTLLADFNEIWNDSKVLQVVTDEVIDSITAAYNENSPDFIYFVTLYNIFSEFLEDVSEDVLPNEATGFKESKIWGMLYNFQKDAALAIINKLEKYNGCILADSVGLGKTFTALAVIKYYENRNKSVLVLCPKKLTNNWNTYKDNYVNNPIAADRLRYDVLYHTDLNRTHGNSNGLDLSRLNWGNYDLVVIDESHNFRNGGKLIVTGLSGFYDENMRCLFMNGFPLKSCFGAEVSEFKVAGEYFTLGEELPAHLWRGILVPASGETMMTDGGDVAAVRNRYGRGEVVWVPSPIELGGYHRDMVPLTAFYGRECRDAIDAAPASFRTPEPDVLMRTMRKEGVLTTVIVNKRPESAAIRLRTGRYGVPRVIYGDASVKGAQVTVGADRCAVVVWSR